MFVNEMITIWLYGFIGMFIAVIIVLKIAYTDK